MHGARSVALGQRKNRWYGHHLSRSNREIAQSFRDEDQTMLREDGGAFARRCCPVPSYLKHLGATRAQTGLVKLSTISGRIPLDPTLIASRPSQNDAREIAATLGKSTALLSLEFVRFGDDYGESLITESDCEDDDIEIVNSWAAACKTLI
ncbi:hypothetical protein C8R44DRAFT_752289 [Mycena epipterygia]|nr:hypothetical protein C8R44DRAFT_752289 [Mycena epipterygia]